MMNARKIELYIVVIGRMTDYDYNNITWIDFLSTYYHESNDELKGEHWNTFKKCLLLKINMQLVL